MSRKLSEENYFIKLKVSSAYTKVNKMLLNMLLDNQEFLKFLNEN